MICGLLIAAATAGAAISAGSTVESAASPVTFTGSCPPGEFVTGRDLRPWYESDTATGLHLPVRGLLLRQQALSGRMFSPRRYRRVGVNRTMTRTILTTTTVAGGRFGAAFRCRRQRGR
jgi:hypothetical protein